MSNSEPSKVIDLKKFVGSHSLGEKFENFVLGDIVKDGLEKIKQAIEQGKNSDTSLKSGYTANNVFLDGRRGSGKTTVLLTIKEILGSDDFKSVRDQNFEDTKFEVINSVIDTSVNISSITFYFLSWLKEQIETKYESDFELHQQLYKTLHLFPKKLIDDNCSHSRTCEIEEIIDKSDLNFKKELFKLIDEYLQKDNKNKYNKYIVLFIDDLDISFPVDRIPQILNEIFMFLSHPNVIVIAAGDYSNLNKMLEAYVEKEAEININDSSNGNRTNTLNKIFNRNVAKSFLEKTFTTHIVRIYELSYEYIKDIQIKESNKELNNGSEFTPICKFLEEKIPIIGLLSFDSVIFKILFDGLTTRELVLMIREVNAVKIDTDKDKNENKNDENNKLKNIPVINLCFSHIYHKIKGFDLELSFDTRINTKLSDENKSSEFDVMAKRIQEYLKEKIEKEEKDKEKEKEEGFFFEDDKHSLLTRTLEIKRKTKDVSLFWLWTIENMLFMDGYVKNIPKMILLDTFDTLFQDNDSSNEEFSNFLNFWGKLHYEIDEIRKIYQEYEHGLKMEKYISVRVDDVRNKELTQLLQGLTIEKVTSESLHLISILEFTENHIRKVSIKTDNVLISNFRFFSILDNFKDKLLKRLTEKLFADERLFLLLLVYINLIDKLYIKAKKLNNLKKDIIFQVEFERYKVIKKTLKDIKKDIKIDWLTQKRYGSKNGVKPLTIAGYIKPLKRYTEQLLNLDILDENEKDYFNRIKEYSEKILENLKTLDKNLQIKELPIDNDKEDDFLRNLEKLKEFLEKIDESENIKKLVIYIVTYILHSEINKSKSRIFEGFSPEEKKEIIEKLKVEKYPLFSVNEKDIEKIKNKYKSFIEMIYKENE